MDGLALLFALLLCLGLATGLALLSLALRRPRATAARCTWRVVLPRDPRFSPAQAAAWFGSLAPLLAAGEPRPSIELRGAGGELEVRLSAPAAWERPLRSQLSAWFPGARLEALPARKVGTGECPTAALSMRLERPELYPVRLAAPAAASAAPDPLLSVYGLLSNSELPAGFRLAWGPAPRDWSTWAPAALAALQAGLPPPPRGAAFWLVEGLQRLTGNTPPAANSRPHSASHARLTGVLTKVQEPVFAVSLQVFAAGAEAADALQQCRALAEQLRTAFRDPLGNAFAPAGSPVLESALHQERWGRGAIVLSAAELAALFHVPAPDHPLVPGERSRRVPPPPDLDRVEASKAGPVTCLGEALYPERAVPFGLGLAERRQHTYVVGKTGTGKSTLIATLLRQDLEQGRGVGLIDPHGDLAELALGLVPPARAAEVLYFNPADAGHPVGFNPLAVRVPEQLPLVASGVVSAFKKLFGESWGPRLEHFLRNSVLALLETPSPSLLLLPRLLTDPRFRAGVLRHVRDPLLRTFFLEEYERYEPRWRMEAISPILNKVGQFLSSPVVRHVVGQQGPGFDLRHLMDRGGILIANLASGRIGEDNTALLGALLVSAFQLAAMSRADLPEAERRDFGLCVDEFQHFATEAFAQVLSEARKYRLSLTLSHQYLDQLPPGISGAVFGNAASLCVFRVGAGDTARLARELAPVFDAQDLVHLPNHHFCARITRGGEVVPPFSARTVPLPETHRDPAPLLAASRARWSRPRAEVELEIGDLWEGRTG